MGRYEKVTQVQVNVSFSMAANTQWQDMGQHNCRPSTSRHRVKVYFDKPVQGRYVKIKVDAWERHISMRAGLIVASISESKFASQGIGRLSGAFVWTPKSNMEGMYTVNFEARSGHYDEVPAYKTLSLKVVSNLLPPTSITVVGTASLDENSIEGKKIVSLYTVDPNPNDKHTYSLLQGNKYFKIVGNELRSGSFKIDFETTQYVIVEIASSDGTFNVTKLINVSVHDINEPPVGLGLVQNRIQENANTGSVIANLTAIDYDNSLDKHWVHTFEIVSGGFWSWHCWLRQERTKPI